ncbi:alpha/beta hydrolase [Sinorhizobium mexicanum]|uniref:Alpha/beta fold hydrolase n=1 Tax=Sinorhizobium mexicanum TaxID=375549 RepID=A0A859QJG6_9HYPH|nr:alpha/beta hydrolase [Sinorhizobium mexicanum]MBP1884365.1 arylformamidase [Sinorhizobium mexicanum]QLL65044.1 alpha/beta fold hydrolase [Sinorhizobium mexicanum]
MHHSWHNYDVAAATPGIAAIQAELARRSAAILTLPQAIPELRYAEGDRGIMAVMPAACGATRPIVAFVHGGGWASGCPRERFHPASAFADAGCVWAAIGYPLRPTATMVEMISAVRAAIDHLRNNADSVGGDPGRIHLVGHSAGAMLAAAAACIPGTAKMLSGLTLISGVLDLRPLLVNDSPYDLGLTGSEAEALSPLPGRLPDTPMVIALADGDPPGMKAQMLALHLSRPAGGSRLVYRHGRNHLSILNDLTDPDSILFQAILEQATRSAAHPG